MPSAQAAAVGRLLAEVLDYIEAQKVVRLDLKPSTVVMADRAGPSSSTWASPSGSTTIVRPSR
jgi:hypothetical protein